MRANDLLYPKSQGLYCPPGNFYIDPVRPVDKALITHGHADHARAGHGAVLATKETLEIMAIRYGRDFAGSTQIAEMGKATTINGVSVTYFPAGHVLGSAQILVEKNGLKIVASGDYKRVSDPTCASFEIVECDTFITEATFGLPVFRHPSDRGEIRKLLKSVEQFPERAHFVGAYSLGKAQRVIKLIRNEGYDAPIFIHGALRALCDLYQSKGIDLGQLHPATVENGNKGDYLGAIIVGPPSAYADKWSRRFPDPLPAFASGWMQVRQRAKQRGVELPLIISDHADWDDLTRTIIETKASEVWVTHGREEALVRWCELQQIKAQPLNLVGYEEDDIS